MVKCATDRSEFCGFELQLLWCNSVNVGFLVRYVLYVLSGPIAKTSCMNIPVVLRYDSKYAALITTGVYKAKKNKPLVRSAQKEWKLTVAFKRDRLWLRHVKGHSGHRWNDRADHLANVGRGGTARYGTPCVD